MSRGTNQGQKFSNSASQIAENINYRNLQFVKSKNFFPVQFELFSFSLLTYLLNSFSTISDPDLIEDENDVVFNRHAREDVKKPGPFFEASPNNFYLDKLTYRYYFLPDKYF